MTTNKMDMSDNFDSGSDISSDYEEITPEPVLLQVTVGTGEHFERFHVHDNFLGSQSVEFKNLVRNVSDGNLYISHVKPQCFLYFLTFATTGDYNIDSGERVDQTDHRICGCDNCLSEKSDNQVGLALRGLNIIERIKKYTCKPKELIHHAELWEFADRYELTQLNELACSYLKSALDKIPVNKQNVRDIVHVLRHIHGYKSQKLYNSINSRATDEGWKNMRIALCGFCKREISVLKVLPDFVQFLKEGGQFCVDFQQLEDGQSVSRAYC